MHRYLLHNGSICENTEKRISPGQVGYMNGWGVFSTLQVIDGVLFAYERHWARMQRDAARMAVPFPDSPGWLQERLLELIEANQAYAATLRVAVVRNRGGLFEADGIERDYDLVAFTTGLHDWGAGVRLAVQPQARHAACPFAGTKILSWAFNLTWLEKARQRGFDEVILLNERDEVSECSSANIFMTEGETIWTPPLSSGCLAGITRELLLELGRAQGLPVGERTFSLDALRNADAVFITSTTRGLLPVLRIEDAPVAHRDACENALRRIFAGFVQEYVAGAGEKGLSAPRSSR